uniref:Chromatin modification-related protein EAF7-like n=1 Tax=Nicotiana sylvestris TaxID=4096 RepID=A0A1U7YN02_NICSY|nr:PREDICTED: chromatin modification-related protein EAF7-like [Nicotiana sylvestris]
MLLDGASKPSPESAFKKSQSSPRLRVPEQISNQRLLWNMIGTTKDPAQSYFHQLKDGRNILIQVQYQQQQTGSCIRRLREHKEIRQVSKEIASEARYLEPNTSLKSVDTRPRNNVGRDPDEYGKLPEEGIWSRLSLPGKPNESKNEELLENNKVEDDQPDDDEGVKADGCMKSKNDEPTTKRAEVTTSEAKAVTEEVQPNVNKSYRGNIASCGKKSMLGKLPSEDATRQPREGLGYKQLSLVRISIRRASSNYITIEDESAASNKPSVFDRLGKSPPKTSMFERLGPLKKGNKF